jgi:microcystin-dependent protein
MALDIPLPTEAPQDDPAQYTPLLLSAIEGFLLARDVWAEADYADARQYMQQLMVFIVELMEHGTMQPIGSISMFAGDTQPPKWLICNGGEVDRLIYSELFAVIGTTYGVGDGTDTFNVPDFTERSPMGLGDTTPIELGTEYGSPAVALTIGNMPNHDHDYVDPGHTHRVPKQSATVNAAVNVATPAARTDNPASPHITTDVASTGITFHAQGSNNPHLNVHPVLGVQFIIYAGIL